MRLLVLLSIVALGACTSEGQPEPQGDTDDTAGEADVAATDTAECWWCVDAGPDSVLPDLSKPPGDDGKKGDGKDGYLIWSAEIDLETNEGTYRFREYDPASKQATCDVSYQVVAEPNDTCAECTLAMDFQLGQGEVSATSGSDLCDGQSKLSGGTVAYGHKAPDMLYIYKEGWALLAEGASEVANETWSFEFLFGGAAGK